MKTRKLFLTLGLITGLMMFTSCDEKDNPVSSSDDSEKLTEFKFLVDCQKSNEGEWTNDLISMTFKVTSEDPAEVRVNDCALVKGTPTKITIPENVQVIVVLQGQEGYEEQYAVTSIGVMAFMDGTDLTEVTLPSSLKEICGFAFGNCKSLESIDIPANVENIEAWAFDGCTNLKKAVIHGEPTIQPNAFPQETELVYAKDQE